MTHETWDVRDVRVVNIPYQFRSLALTVWEGRNQWIQYKAVWGAALAAPGLSNIPFNTCIYWQKVIIVLTTSIYCDKYRPHTYESSVNQSINQSINPVQFWTISLHLNLPTSPVHYVECQTLLDSHSRNLDWIGSESMVPGPQCVRLTVIGFLQTRCSRGCSTNTFVVHWLIY